VRGGHNSDLPLVEQFNPNTPNVLVGIVYPEKPKVLMTTPQLDARSLFYLNQII
jgi:hypothetical protein